MAAIVNFPQKELLGIGASAVLKEQLAVRLVSY